MLGDIPASDEQLGTTADVAKLLLGFTVWSKQVPHRARPSHKQQGRCPAKPPAATQHAAQHAAHKDCRVASGRQARHRAHHLGSRTPREGVPVGVVRRQGQGQRQSPRRAVLSAATLGRILMWLAMILWVTAANWNNGTLVQGAGAPDAPRNRGLQQSLSWQRAVWYGPGCAS